MQVDGAPEENDNINDEPQYLVENPTLDLEQYASQYTGLAKLHRLMYISDHCPGLKVEALRMALTYVMTTFNTNLYGIIHRKLQEAASTLVYFTYYHLFRSYFDRVQHKHLPDSSRPV